MDYNQAIYELLLDWLPSIYASLEVIGDFVFDLRTAVQDLLVFASDYKLFLAVLAFTSVLALILKRRFLV